MQLDAGKPSMPLVIRMFFKNCLFKPTQSSNCVTELVFFLLMGCQKFFTANPARMQRKSQQDPPVCYVFYLQSKGFSLILRKGGRGGNRKDWDLSREVNCGHCTLDPSSADHFSKLF